MKDVDPMKLKTRLCVVAGARPNFMKIAPIMREANAHPDDFDVTLVHTGQHYDHEMSDVFFDELGIPKPNHYLEVAGGSHAEQTARTMTSFEGICEAVRPDLVVVVGDVNSTLACSITAKKLGIKVAHVEAGLRSGDRLMPEEINRIVTDSISDLFFVTEPSGVENLLREGHPRDVIHFVGHVMIDNLFFQRNRLENMDVSSFKTNDFKMRNRDYAVLTLHRPSNVDDVVKLRELMEVLSQLSDQMPLIFPVHPRTRRVIEENGIPVSGSILMTKPLPYMEFLNLWKDAKVVLTDSGGLQEESTALGVPCITLRDSTERPITVTAGTNVLVGRDWEKLRAEFRRASTSRRVVRSAPPLWDGQAASRIFNVLKNYAPLN